MIIMYFLINIQHTYIYNTHIDVRKHNTSCMHVKGLSLNRKFAAENYISNDSVFKH